MEIVRSIQNRIYDLRGERVMFDFDIAELYEVAIKVLNQAVKRNIKRFPEDFMFRLSITE
ncbi:MAG TPA: ORF6N domain-containing protein [Puia sp.]